MTSQEPQIITIRKQDIRRAYQAFAELMQKTESMMNDKANSDPQSYKGMKPKDLEINTERTIKEACKDTPFENSKVELRAGFDFPDIVAEKYYGVEVKQTKSNKWTSIGSSIVESRRWESVEDIYMLFGKLGGDIPEFRCRPYQDVLREIAVTHSPRYIVDMEIGEEDTIFSKMGTDYNTFRNSSDSIEQVRHYYRKKATEKKEMPWWLTSSNVEKEHSFNIKLWNSLDKDQKRELQNKCMVLFPEALNPARSMSKYNNTTLWLCAYNQVVNPNVRDMYSAGGKITHVNGEPLETPAAQVFKTIVEHAEDIKTLLDEPSEEMLSMIKEFNPELLEGNDMYKQWLNMCFRFASDSNVPLEEWLQYEEISFKQS